MNRKRIIAVACAAALALTATAAFWPRDEPIENLVTRFDSEVSYFHRDAQAAITAPNIGTDERVYVEQLLQEHDSYADRVTTAIARIGTPGGSEHIARTFLTNYFDECIPSFRRRLDPIRERLHNNSRPGSGRDKKLSNL